MGLGIRIPENIINELRDRCDIVEYIGRYVNLRRKGSNYIGLCPFHKEKTPSFVVNREKRIFHCFGCGEGGNLFTFLSKIESKGFFQIINELAKENGIKIETDKDAERISEHFSRLQSICYTTMMYYHDSLYSKEGEAALTYLKKRGITESLIAEHKLGYAPLDPKEILQRLERLGFPIEDILDAGVFTKSSGIIHDRFSGRLVIPLINADQKVVGFAGRRLSDDKGVAKYINSPESAIYHKGSFLYGMNVASRQIYKTGYLIIVEGYFDLISLNSINILNVAATCGTTLTQSHIRGIKRFTKEVYLCFDGDSAGRSAVYKVAKVLIPSGINISILPLPAGEDPDSFTRKNGFRGFSEIISRRSPFLTYLCEDAKRAIKARPHMKATYMKKMLVYIDLIPDIIEQREAIRSVSKEMGVEEDLLFRYMKGSQERIDRIESERSSQYKSYETWLIAILLQFPHLIENIPENLYNMFESDIVSETLINMLRLYKEGGLSPSAVYNSPLYPEITRIQINRTFPLNESDAFSILLDCLHRIQMDFLKKNLKEIDKKIQTAKETGDETQLNNLLKEKIEISKSIKLREIKYG